MQKIRYSLYELIYDPDSTILPWGRKMKEQCSFNLRFVANSNWTIIFILGTGIPVVLRSLQTKFHKRKETHKETFLKGGLRCNPI